MKRALFLIMTGVLAALFVVAMWQDTDREWTRYQQQFRKTLSRDERRGLSGGIKQFIIADLDRVDRCTTCHVAIDKPALALGEEPFMAHPGQFLEWHPPEKFGCTVCHGGQGLATEVKAAHGDVAHWDEPLLRGTLVQASCRQCHGDLDAIREHVPQLLAGQQLFETKGCYACHAVKAFGKEFGGTISQELTDVGLKPYLLLEADFEMMPPPHDRIHWLMTKLRNPRIQNPGVGPDQLPPGEEEVFPSAMPNFGLTEEEVRVLTTYVLSLTGRDLPVSYVTAPGPTPVPVYASRVEFGRAVFEKYGCAGCHGAGGVGGRKNWNAGLGEEIPPLVYAKAYYGNDVESLKQLIRNGRQPVPRANPRRPTPSLYMPAWKDRISEDELNALVEYLFSLADRLPSPQASEVPAEPAAVN
jgi:mono/diheme cytochrome c family protein